MSDIELGMSSGSFSEGRFEDDLRKAEGFVETQQWEQAREVLSDLKDRYIESVRILDMLGDVLLNVGNTKEGIRFKTLHEVLKGTFRIVEEETRSAPRPPMRKPRGPAKPQVPPRPMVSPIDGTSEQPVVPVTFSAAEALMQQGHLDQAVVILRQLILQNPEDESLKQVYEQARKKQKYHQLRGVFQRWLQNLDQIKARQAGA